MDGTFFDFGFESLEEVLEDSMCFLFSFRVSAFCWVVEDLINQSTFST